MPEAQAAITRAARVTRVVAVVVLALTLFVQFAAYAWDSPHIMLHRPGSWASGIIAVLHFGFMIAAFVQLFLLLHHLEKGALFSEGVTRHLRRFALLMMLAVLSIAVLAPLLSLLEPGCVPSAPCPRRLPIDLRSLWMLLISLLFFLVARILDEARRIDDDNKQII